MIDTERGPGRILVISPDSSEAVTAAVEDAVGRPVVEPVQWAVAAALGALRLAAC